jgi:hypothetical protein
MTTLAVTVTVPPETPVARTEYGEVESEAGLTVAIPVLLEEKLT